MIKGYKKNPAFWRSFLYVEGASPFEGVLSSGTLTVVHVILGQWGCIVKIGGIPTELSGLGVIHGDGVFWKIQINWYHEGAVQLTKMLYSYNKKAFTKLHQDYSCGRERPCGGLKYQTQEWTWQRQVTLAMLWNPQFTDSLAVQWLF